MCIYLGPLKGHLDIDILDSAFATAHIGIIGYDFDFFRAELCVKGGIDYGLNILKVRHATVLSVIRLFCSNIPKHDKCALVKPLHPSISLMFS